MAVLALMEVLVLRLYLLLPCIEHTSLRLVDLPLSDYTHEEVLHVLGLLNKTLLIDLSLPVLFVELYCLFLLIDLELIYL